jgi:hypothetical protein
VFVIVKAVMAALLTLLVMFCLSMFFLNIYEEVMKE